MLNEGRKGRITFEENAKYLKIGKSTPYKMAGEGKIQMTEIYTHLSRTNLAKIENPLDRLMEEGED